MLGSLLQSNAGLSLLISEGTYARFLGFLYHAEARWPGGVERDFISNFPSHPSSAEVLSTWYISP